MLIIGCDFHPGFQQVAIFDKRTGEYAGKTFGSPPGGGTVLRGSLAGQEVRVGMEACGHYPWFERLLAEVGHRAVAGGRGPDPGCGGAAAEDGPAGRGTLAAAVAGRTGFRGSGCRVWKSGTCGSCWCIATSKCRRGRGPRTSCTRWP